MTTIPIVHIRLIFNTFLRDFSKKSTPLVGRQTYYTTYGPLAFSRSSVVWVKITTLKYVYGNMEVLAVIKIIFMEISPYFEAVPPLIS
jgi:hypothetical protein